MNKSEAIARIKAIPNEEPPDIFYLGLREGYKRALIDAFGISESEITVNTNSLQELADQFGIKVE